MYNWKLDYGTVMFVKDGCGEQLASVDSNAQFQLLTGPMRNAKVLHRLQQMQRHGGNLLGVVNPVTPVGNAGDNHVAEVGVVEIPSKFRFKGTHASPMVSTL
jgi:hypothetical protein